MATKILFSPKQPDDDHRRSRELTPPGFELVVVDPGTPEFIEAAQDAEYYMGLARQMGGEFFRSAPEDQAGPAAERRLRPRGHRGGAQGQGAGVQQRRRQRHRRGRAHDHADPGRAQAGGDVPQRHRGRQVARGRTHRRRRCTSWPGSTLGIVGLGNIGKKVARRALAFDMQGAVLRHRAAHRGPGRRARRALRRSSPSCCRRPTSSACTCRSTTPRATSSARASWR